MASKPVVVTPAELRHAWADLAHSKADVELAKKELAAAQRELLRAHAALADAQRLTRLCSWPGLLTVGQRRASGDEE
jgi:hypothetical protein